MLRADRPHHLIAPLVAALVLAAAGAPVAAAAEAPAYVVGLKAPPLASYTGGRAGIPATAPQVTGARRLDVRTAAARAYRRYLDGRERAALALVPGTVRTGYRYRTAFAGFSARLSAAQVAALRRAPQVAAVWRDARSRIQQDPGEPAPPDPPLPPDLTDASAVDLLLNGPSGFGDSAAYLGLPAGLWDALGGPTHAGEDVIVGDLDTGITPQHPSFAATAEGSYLGPDYGPVPARWRGACESAEDPIAPNPAAFCSPKLIGARAFVDGFGRAHLAPGSFTSPRDDDGHGTHTAAIAAGNFGVDPSIDGNDLAVDRISGIAPRALIAAYKICWVGGDVPDGCANSDAVAAIDTAVADGVDVINYSVGGPGSNVIDPVEFAFLGASHAGVSVITSAGNGGPAAGTVGNPSSVPWVTAVAADEPARTFVAPLTVTPGDGTEPFVVDGASVAGAPVSAPLVDAGAIPAAGHTADEARLCQAGTLDPAGAAGRIVVCRRGDNDRIDKSLQVRDAGGVGMVLVNATATQDTNADSHWVPTVQVTLADGDRVAAAAAAGATARIAAGAAALGTPKVLPPFTARGPQTAVPDIAKPDLAAPGVNVLGGMTPDPAPATGLRPGALFQVISGTSMAAPHVAGAAVLLTQVHPDWTPAAIKSALVTTADPAVRLEDAVTPATLFDAGAGELNPTPAASPGLVLDVSTFEYARYVEAVAPDIFNVADPIQPRDLNLPAIAASAVTGPFSTVRRVRSVDTTPREWTAAIDVPGFDATATVGGAATFTVDPGATAVIDVTATATTASPDQWAAGALTLTSGESALRIPVALRPIAPPPPAS